jgi:acyl carrier protein
VSDLAGEVADVVALWLGRRRVLPTQRVIEDLDARSIDIVNIVAALEERYEVCIDEERLALMVTVQDLADEVDRLVGSA